MLRALAAHRNATVGAALLAVIVLGAIVGPLVTADPSALVARPHEPPSAAHLLGTTGQGQDVFAQTLAGARTTLAIGFAVGALVVAIGAFVGIAAAYAGGWVEALLTSFTQIALVIPGLPLAVVLAAYLPPGPLTLALVLVVTGWAWNARVVHAQATVIRRQDYVAAAIVGGESHARVIFAEMLPNMAPLLVAQLIGATTYAILAQVGLEFLGLGDLSAVTWGTNLYWAANDSALLTGSWWTFVPTGVGVALVGFALTLIGFAVDEVGNPGLAAERAWRRALRGRGGRGGRGRPGRLGASTPVVHDD